MLPEILSGAAGFVAGSVVDKIALKQSFETAHAISEVHNIATEEFIANNPNADIKRHTLSKFIARSIMELAGAATFYGVYKMVQSTTEVAPPKNTPFVIIDGTAAALDDQSYMGIKDFSVKAFAKDPQIRGILVESDHIQALRNITSSVLSQYDGNIGGPNTILSSATQSEINAAGNTTNEGPIVVITDGVSVGSPGAIENQESNQRKIPLYIVDEKNCSSNQMNIVAQETGGHCWPMNNPGTVANVDSVINTKINRKSVPTNNFDWEWFGVTMAGAAIAGAGYLTRRTGVLPHYFNVIGE